MALRKKKRGAKIISLGLLFPIIALLLIIAISIILKSVIKIDLDDKYGLMIVIALAISPISIPISMAIYLAREMVMNNKSLEQQIVEIKRLSEDNIAHEQEKQKMIAEQNINLEQQVKERTAEIEQQKEEITAQRDDILEKSEILEQQNEEIRTQSEEITAQRDALSYQKNEIVSSIQYAQRIQNAVLPSLDSFKEVFSDFFVLYKPRDIVSGDFYWLRKVNNQVIQVTADCTGHGVPGAFMSILAISLLNEIMGKSNLDNAGEILNNLRKKIKIVLHQQGKDSEQKDGMDIALCIYDLENNTMQYAGAYNSLYLVRNNELIEYKADLQPCAVHILESDFTTHFIKIKKGDIIYTFSDGYVDQRGGVYYKKYMAKNFRNYLLSICHEPLEKQKELLDRNIETWKNGKEQIDDITVVGVKI
jgi:serine phosphatase RsbU (regulator of sigma subunit)